MIIATIAFAGAMLVNFLLSLFGVDLGRGTRNRYRQPVGSRVSLLGAVLAVLNLVLDFDYIEKGVAMGAPAAVVARGLR